jgi:hypothetical protein
MLQTHKVRSNVFSPPVQERSKGSEHHAAERHKQKHQPKANPKASTFHARYPTAPRMKKPPEGG